ncbi:PP2C family protein-serine/threonine phosphatase [Streptomyces sp. NPDC050560]|uniref:PP2C family protein-serine/threonine phosphatase n=1 Tax=Streptomyces sp. NPDC050560 TaxID=3365630 RepID=UPI0037BC79AC
MPQMPPSAAGPTCPNPSCREPVEPGDRFCGVCGRDLEAVPVPGDDRPTIAISAGAPARVGAAATGKVEWPTASDLDSDDTPVPVHGPADVPGLDSGGSPLHGAASAPATASGGGGAPAAERGGTTDGDDYRLAAPRPAADPRAEPEEEAAPGRVCVFCAAGRVDRDDYCEHCGKAQPRERDHMEQELGAVAAVSDRGLRHHRNEDAFALSATALKDGAPAVIAVVCDGVSSATRPDEASRAACDTAVASLLDALPRGTHPQQAMHEAIIAAADAVNDLADEPGSRRGRPPQQNAPACTLVGAVIARDLLVIGWVGDSRAYWVPIDRSAPASRLTQDDSWAAQMVAAGLMNEAEAYADDRAHAITGWLGADAYELEPHTESYKLDRPGVVVVCTDGLWNYAEAAEEMAAVVPWDAGERPLHGAQKLVGHALGGGGHDNVTVAVLPFPVPPQGAGPA